MHRPKQYPQVRGRTTPVPVKNSDLNNCTLPITAIALEWIGPRSTLDLILVVDLVGRWTIHLKLMLSKLDNLNISHTRCEHQASLKPSPRHLPYLSLWKQSASLNTPVHSQLEVYIEVGFTSTSALDTVPKSTGHKNVESM